MYKILHLFTAFSAQISTSWKSIWRTCWKDFGKSNFL